MSWEGASWTIFELDIEHLWGIQITISINLIQQGFNQGTWIRQISRFDIAIRMSFGLGLEKYLAI